MTRRSFALRLLVFLAPFGALMSAPLLVLSFSSEIKTAEADARLVAQMADAVPWLDDLVDQAELRRRVAASPAGPLLAAAQ